jgi:ribonuclease HI
MNRVVHLHARQMNVRDCEGYSSGITELGNPGVCSAAYLLMAPNGTELAKELVNTGLRGSGHDAEYLALRLLSSAVKSRFRRVRRLSLFSSSQLVVNQLSGRWRIRVPLHQQFVEEISLNLHDLEWSIEWTPAVANPIKAWHWKHYEEKGDTEGEMNKASYGDL